MWTIFHQRQQDGEQSSGLHLEHWCLQTYNSSLTSLNSSTRSMLNEISDIPVENGLIHVFDIQTLGNPDLHNKQSLFCNWRACLPESCSGVFLPLFCSSHCMKPLQVWWNAEQNHWPLIWLWHVISDFLQADLPDEVQFHFQSPLVKFILPLWNCWVHLAAYKMLNRVHEPFQPAA